MIRGLLEKELRQHAATFAFLIVVVLVGLTSITGNRFLSQATGTGLAGLKLLLVTMVPLASLALGHVLIVGEYSQKTQLFLEGLPLPRWRILAVKYGLGLVVLSISAAAALLVALRNENGAGALTPDFVTILVAKTFTWVFFVFSLFFAYTFLGRYRIPAAVVLAFGLIHLQELGYEIGIPLGKFAALQLIDHRFAYEAHHLPRAEILVTILVSLVLVGLAFWLGLARDASLATMLAHRMSGREKVFFSFVVLGAMMSVVYTQKRREEAEAVYMPGAFESEHGIVYVAGSAAVNAPTSVEEAAVKRLVPRALTEFEELAKYLGCVSMPRVFIVHRRDFAGDRFENGDLKQQQGLMLRANLTSEAFSEDAFLERLVREVLLLKSSNRAEMELNVWVLDGFPSWWIHRQQRLVDLKKPSAGIVEPPRVHTQSTISKQDLTHWYTFRKTLKDGDANVLASDTIEKLRVHYGEQACRAFLASMFARDLPSDVRGWLRDALDPTPRRFERATGVPLERFVDVIRSGASSSSSQTPSAE